MRLFAPLVALALMALPLSAVSDANFAKMHFADGQERSVDDFKGRTLAVFAFCKS